MKLLGNKVMIKINNVETINGVMIPTKADSSHPQIGEIEAVGDSCELPIKIGDKVVFAKNMNYEIALENEKKHIVDGEDILAIL